MSLRILRSSHSNIAERIFTFGIVLGVTGGLVIANTEKLFDLSKLLSITPDLLLKLLLLLAVVVSIAAAVLTPIRSISLFGNEISLAESGLGERVQAASDKLDSVGSPRGVGEKEDSSTTAGPPRPRSGDFKPAWDIARLSLDQYWLSNIAQNRRIFFLSVLVISCGFLVMLVGVGHALSSTAPDSAAVTATLGGVLTQFIGATFLFIYTSTVRQSAAYVKTMERINSVGMAWYVLETMPSRTPEEQQAQNIARGLLVQQIMNVQQARDSATET